MSETDDKDGFNETSWPQILNQKIGSHMRSWRERAGFTIPELSLRLKISEQDLHHWESGKGSPKAEKFHEILQVLGDEATTEAAFVLNMISLEAQEMRRRMKTPKNSDD